MAPERVLFMFGNCQAHFLAAALMAQGEGPVCIVGQLFGFRPEWRGVQPFFIDPARMMDIAGRAKRAGRQVVIVEQTSPMQPLLVGEITSVADHVVRFPHLEIQAYWPHRSENERRFEPDWIKRRWDFDLVSMRRSEKAAGWDGAFVDDLAARHAKDNLFHTFNHPGGNLIGLLHERIGAQLLAISETRDTTNEQRTRKEIVAEGGIAFMADHPIRRVVAEALGLTWPDVPWYRAWSNAVEAAGKGDFAGSRRFIENALADPRCDQHVWYGYGLVLEALGEHFGAHDAFAQAYRAFPQNPVYAEKWMAGLDSPGDSGEHPLLEPLKARYRFD